MARPLNRHHPKSFKLIYGAAPLAQRPVASEAERDDDERKKAEFIKQHGVRKLPARKGDM